ncbi:hypothetical protein EA187_09215 [Lujinxingia sediminis]|uniref:Transposase n=1 Tax=Lujinxingia sediminis TaxID=2480984 RepID=A0ABY0CSY3_9DELT|nr:hypothetical protein [Lujinxingia sediminis]RVU44712.1 hypothetical protein EA187_09215 [Lujinxingia sediminis]
MSEELPEDIKRWTSKRRTALVLQIIRGETTVNVAARQYSAPPDNQTTLMTMVPGQAKPVRIGLGVGQDVGLKG